VILATTVAELNAALAPAREAGQKVALVPTMGALHDGHVSLVDLARVHADVVVVSIFVNPKQFGEGEDFDRYPRTLDADLAALDGKADIVFSPSVDEVYPAGVEIPAKQAGPVGATFEGEARPGHFDGMLTVVARLFTLVQPNIAVFGEKDAQQLFLVRQLAKNEFPGLRIIGAEIVRQPNGVAMSSRNRFLNAEQGDIAEILAITLATISELIEAGMDVRATLAMGVQMISGEPETKLEYLALVDPETFTPVGENFSGPALLLVAAIVGGVRLIDNHLFEIPA
jgi:pantoate--beta-alanine ligase